MGLPTAVSDSTFRLIAEAMLRAPTLAPLSCDNHHVPGLRYACLGRAVDPATGRSEVTIKAYVFEPGKWSPAAGELVVHPHDHAYDFTTRVLAGEVTNHLFVDGGPNTRRRRRHGVLFGANNRAYRRAFVPREGFSAVGERVLFAESRRETHRRGGSYAMRADEVHSISVPEGVPTVLFLTQGRTIRSATRAYFSDDSPPPTLDGLYKPMTVRRYLNTLDLIIRRIRAG